MTAVFLQARMDSARFPGKIVASFHDSTVIESAMKRLDPVPVDLRVIVTDIHSISVLDPIALKHGWKIFAGHPTDVMKRFIDAADYYKVDVIVRATGDNPLVDTQLATWLLGIQLRSSASSTRVLGATEGTAVEIVTAAVLRGLYTEASIDQREHIMPVVYRRVASNIVYVAPLYAQSVTIDTPEDLARVSAMVLS